MKRLRIFGIVGFRHIPKEKRSKLDEVSTEARFLCYAEGKNGYIVKDLKTRKIGFCRVFISSRIIKETTEDAKLDVLPLVPDDFYFEASLGNLDSNLVTLELGNNIEEEEERRNVLGATDFNEVEPVDVPNWSDISQQNIVSSSRREGSSVSQRNQLFFEIKRLLSH